MSAISVRWLSISWGAVIFETNYGLMQHSHIEIKNKLLKALDAEYNVVDMATVFEVVTILEKIPITQEILEATRLGKLINGFRRKTQNEVLAKRAKDLVRRWRNMMIPTESEGASSSSQQHNGTLNCLNKSKKKVTINNDHRHHNTTTTPNASLICDPEIDSVPKTHAANKRLRKDDASESVDYHQQQPPLKKCKLNGIISNCKPILLAPEHNAMITTPPLPPSLHLVNNLNNLPNNMTMTTENKKVIEKHQTTSPSSSVSNVPENNASSRKKRARKKDNKHCYNDVVKEKLVALSKTVKVKTTQELVNDLMNHDLVASSETSLSNNIHPTVNRDVLPIQTKDKSEHADKLLRSHNSSTVAVTDNSSKVKRTVDDEINEILSKLPPLDLDSIIWSDDETDVPPNILSKSNTLSFTEEDVNRLHKEQIEGVNGVTDHADQQFKEWHEMVSHRTANDDLIHILPYTIVD